MSLLCPDCEEKDKQIAVLKEEKKSIEKDYRYLQNKCESARAENAKSRKEIEMLKGKDKGFWDRYEVLIEDAEKWRNYKAIRCDAGNHPTYETEDQERIAKLTEEKEKLEKMLRLHDNNLVGYIQERIRHVDNEKVEGLKTAIGQIDVEWCNIVKVKEKEVVAAIREKVEKIVLATEGGHLIKSGAEIKAEVLRALTELNKKEGCLI